MGNKGFIATGLIYSFFLIFLTLFLTTITSHIKNKVSLGYIEDEIKESLNAHKTISDFNPGDLISFVDYCMPDDVPESFVGDKSTLVYAGVFDVNESYVVASVITNESDTVSTKVCPSGIKDCLILYSYALYNDFSVDEDTLEYSDLVNDISTGYLNETYINKILYNFDSLSGMSYNLGVGKFAKVNTTDSCNADVGDEIFCNDYGKIVSSGDNNYRKRLVKTFNNNKVEKCKVEDAMGVIYVKE